MVFLRIQVLTFLPCRERQRIKECNRPFGCYQKKMGVPKSQICIGEALCRTGGVQTADPHRENPNETQINPRCERKEHEPESRRRCGGCCSLKFQRENQWEEMAAKRSEGRRETVRFDYRVEVIVVSSQKGRVKYLLSSYCFI